MISNSVTLLHSLLHCDVFVADLVTSLSLATAGLPRMAFSGCYGGPLLSILYKCREYINKDTSRKNVVTLRSSNEKNGVQIQCGDVVSTGKTFCSK